MPFDFLGRVEEIDSANLTIREQARLAENPNALRWRGIFPYTQSPSVKLSELSAVDFRPVGGRREWNAQGREVPEILGAPLNAEMVPINPTHHIDERRMQSLRERAGGTGELISSGIIKDVDDWAETLTDAADRQIELDAFQAWFQNAVTVMDPKTGDTQTVSMGIDSGRYPVAADTLTAAGNAYDDFVGYLEDAQSQMGSVAGVRLRRQRLKEILEDAPAVSGDRATITTLQQRVADNGFDNFTFIVDERTYDSFDDGGSAFTQEYYVPSDRMAFQPAGGVVGATHFAPVTRAYDYMDTARVDTLNDFAVFRSEKNDGKTLMVEAQANALPLPIEQYVYVVTGIA